MIAWVVWASLLASVPPMTGRTFTLVRSVPSLSFVSDIAYAGVAFVVGLSAARWLRDPKASGLRQVLSKGLLAVSLASSVLLLVLGWAAFSLCPQDDLVAASMWLVSHMRPSLIENGTLELALWCLAAFGCGAFHPRGRMGGKAGDEAAHGPLAITGMLAFIVGFLRGPAWAGLLPRESVNTAVDGSGSLLFGTDGPSPLASVPLLICVAVSLGVQLVAWFGTDDGGGEEKMRLLAAPVLGELGFRCLVRVISPDVTILEHAWALALIAQLGLSVTILVLGVRTLLSSRSDDTSGGVMPSVEELRQHGLTEREATMARLTCTGMTSSEVAGRLSVSPSTVRNTLQRVYRKLGVTSRDGLVSYLCGDVPADQSVSKGEGAQASSCLVKAVTFVCLAACDLPWRVPGVPLLVGWSCKNAVAYGIASGMLLGTLGARRVASIGLPHARSTWNALLVLAVPFALVGVACRYVETGLQSLLLFSACTIVTACWVLAILAPFDGTVDSSRGIAVTRIRCTLIVLAASLVTLWRSSIWPFISLSKELTPFLVVWCFGLLVRLRPRGEKPRVAVVAVLICAFVASLATDNAQAFLLAFGVALVLHCGAPSQSVLLWFACSLILCASIGDLISDALQTSLATNTLTPTVPVALEYVVRSSVLWAGIVVGAFPLLPGRAASRRKRAKA